jgi:hypothetical protein
MTYFQMNVIGYEEWGYCWMFVLRGEFGSIGIKASFCGSTPKFDLGTWQVKQCHSG